MDGVRGGGLVRDSRGVGDLLEWGSGCITLALASQTRVRRSPETVILPSKFSPLFLANTIRSQQITTGAFGLRVGCRLQLRHDSQSVPARMYVGLLLLIESIEGFASVPSCFGFLILLTVHQACYRMKRNG